MKKMYNTPKIETQPMVADAHVMLLDSNSGPQPGQGGGGAPARGVAPAVPGDNL